MKFSYQWIRGMVDGLDIAPRELARLITMKTAECEGVEEGAGGAVIEVDNKSLTHRPDLWGHHGMAREAAAILALPLKEPADLSLLPSGASPVSVSISDSVLCPRYSALLVENISTAPSPRWLRERLESAGLNSINNIVDITNFVMAEIAQPMHAFDADRLAGGGIFVRPARAGESVAALNGETYAVNPADLLIADAAGPVAIAGVIGGRDGAVGESTRRIVFESANFQAAGVRKTSVRLKLRTDASMRFEKSQDPRNTVRGLARAIALLREVCPEARVVGGVCDAGAELHDPPAIRLQLAWLNRKLGMEVPESEVRRILASLGFGVSGDAHGWLLVSVPSWRAARDVSLPDDLVEEIGRIVGYGSIAPCAPRIEAAVPPASPERIYQRHLRAMLSSQGFTEVSNYSFVSEETIRPFGWLASSHLGVANPIAAGQTMMRNSLLPGVRVKMIENSRHLAAFRFFEIGREIHPRESGLPEEIPHLAAAIYARDGGEAGLFEMKRVAECLMPGCEISPAPARIYEHPRRAFEVAWKGVAAGRIFEMHPSLEIGGRGAVLDLDIGQTQRLDRPVRQYRPVRRFPTSAFDLSVIAPARTPAGEIAKRLAACAGADLAAIEYLRQFALPDGMTSLSYRVTVGAWDRTLASGEVAEVRQRLIADMRGAGFDLRV